jgi:hypothetical protein
MNTLRLFLTRRNRSAVPAVRDARGRFVKGNPYRFRNVALNIDGIGYVSQVGGNGGHVRTVATVAGNSR